MKRRRTGRILSYVIAVLMCLNISVTAFAVDEENLVTDTPNVSTETAPQQDEGNVDEESGITDNSAADPLENQGDSEGVGGQ